VSTSPPPDPREGRFDGLARAMTVATVLATAAAVAGAALPGPAGTLAGATMVVVLVAAPLLRVLWLVQRWARRGDRRFAAVGLGVLVVVAVGTVLATV
jgi:hypothetical protein